MSAKKKDLKKLKLLRTTLYVFSAFQNVLYFLEEFQNLKKIKPYNIALLS